MTRCYVCGDEITYGDNETVFVTALWSMPESWGDESTSSTPQAVIHLDCEQALTDDQRRAILHEAVDQRFPVIEVRP